MAPSAGAQSRANATAILDSTIIPILSLATAGATGIGVPAVEPVMNAVLELARMVSMMKANKEDLANLQKSLQDFIDIDTSETSDALKQRLVAFSSNLKTLATECKSLVEKSRLKQFLRSRDYKERIADIKNSVALHIQEFTLYGNISVERLVTEILSNVKAVDEKINRGADRDILATLVCVPARYNANNTPTRCMDGTRVTVINELVTRLTLPPDSSHRIVMLSGLAGSGKSTIAKSVASVLAEQQGNLAASFFFSRDYPDRRDIKHLPSTLARQLADYDTEFRRLLVKFLNDDRTEICSAEPSLQFQKLVVELLAEIPATATPWVICLDALDECGRDRGQAVLRWLSDSIGHIPVNVRFFLTGRPDVPSYLKYDALQSAVYVIVLDDLDPTVVRHDIRLYVERALDGSTWTTRDPWKAQAADLGEITIRAGGLFVFAATAVRYVVSGLPQERPQKSVDYLLRGAPLADLHDLYHKIVDEAVAIPRTGDIRAHDVHHRTTRILNAILHLMEPLPPSDLAALLDIDPDDLRSTLLPLSAVIRVPDGPGDSIRILHLSFREFMTFNIQDTRPDLRCGNEDQQHSLSSDVLRVLHNGLKFNICALPTSYLRNTDFHDLHWRLDTYIPHHLRYACRFWADHLWTTSFNSVTAEMARTLLFDNFLYWLEVLSLLGLVGHAPKALSKLASWAAENDSISRFAKDAKRFISFFADAIIQSAPHIYVSALALAPAKSEVARRFRPQFPRLITIQRGQTNDWPSAMALLEGHSSSIHSVAFSFDGRRIASGSGDKTIRIWDADTGELICEPLRGHNATVQSVAFSPDGTRIASGSADDTVRLWNAETGEAIGAPFQDHRAEVKSVAFSPDGQIIVSGGADKRLHLWDVHKGEARRPLLGHTSHVTSVAFSPDGRCIVSGSYDKTVRRWNARTGEPLGDPITAHSAIVQSVAFSPDGKFFVSGSDDATIRIWNGESGESVGEPLSGYSGFITSVAFSPCSKRVVSSSRDKTLRIWDIASGKPLGEPLEGHTLAILCVAYSPDGTKIASGDYGRPVRVWDTGIGLPSGHPLEGHSAWVTSAAFSPDGNFIVSGSSDGNLRLWDAQSGEALALPFKGHTNTVNSVAFSPDCKIIVSGSDDTTMRVWDAETGLQLRQQSNGNRNIVFAVSFSPDGKYIASGLYDQTVRVWETESGVEKGPPRAGYRDSVVSVAFSPDGRYIVAGSYDHRIRIWNIESEEPGALFDGHAAEITSVAFSPDGKHIVSGSADKTVRIWNVESQNLVITLAGHMQSVKSVSCSPDGRHIVSGSTDGTVRIWNFDTGQPFSEPFEGHTDAVNSVAFSPDGNLILSCSSDHNIRVWDAQFLQKGAVDKAFTQIFPESRGGIRSTNTSKWKIQPSGWVSCRSSELLFWIPGSQRNGFWSPRNILVIGRQQTSLAYENFVHGTEWSLCHI